MQAFYRITQRIKDILTADPDVNTVFFGVDNYRDLYKKAIYPVAHINPVGSNFSSSQQNVVTLEISVLDQRDLSKNSNIESKWLSNDNQIDTLNTAHAVLNRLMATLRYTYNDGIEILSSTDAVPVIFRELDLVDGWLMTVTLAIPNTIDVCIEPGVEPPLPPAVLTYQFSNIPGDSPTEACNDTIAAQLYSIGTLSVTTVLYADIDLSTPFPGGNKWYRSGSSTYRIDADGVIREVAECLEYYITFTVADMAVLKTKMGITDETVVAQWNTAFNTYYGANTFAAFTKVSIVGNMVTLYGGLDVIQVIPLNFVGINSFDTTAPLPALKQLNLADNNIVTFDPSVQITSAVMQQLLLQNNNIVTFNPTLPLPNHSTVINLRGNEIVTFNPTLPLPTGLSSLVLSFNHIVTFDPTIPLPINLQILVLSSNPIVVFNPTLQLPTPLSFLELDTCLIVSFDPTLTFPTLTSISLANNPLTFFNVNLISLDAQFLLFDNDALPQSIVDAILAKAVALSMGTADRIRLQGGTNSCPSPAGEANKATLIAAGADVNTNACGPTTCPLGYEYQVDMHNCDCSFIGSASITNQNALTLSSWYYDAVTDRKITIQGLVGCASGFTRTILDSTKVGSCAEVVCPSTCPTAYIYDVEVYNCDCSFNGTGSIANTEALVPGNWYFDDVLGKKLLIVDFINCSDVTDRNIAASSGVTDCADVVCLAFGYTFDMWTCDCINLGGGNFYNPTALTEGNWFYNPITQNKIVITGFIDMSPTPTPGVNYIDANGVLSCGEVVCPCTRPTGLNQASLVVSFLTDVDSLCGEQLFSVQSAATLGDACAIWSTLKNCGCDVVPDTVSSYNIEYDILEPGGKLYAGYDIPNCDIIVGPGRYFFWDTTINTPPEFQSYFCPLDTVTIVTVGADGIISTVEPCTCARPSGLEQSIILATFSGSSGSYCGTTPNNITGAADLEAACDLWTRFKECGCAPNSLTATGYSRIEVTSVIPGERVYIGHGTGDCTVADPGFYFHVPITDPLNIGATLCGTNTVNIITVGLNGIIDAVDTCIYVCQRPVGLQQKLFLESFGTVSDSPCGITNNQIDDTTSFAQACAMFTTFRTCLCPYPLGAYTSLQIEFNTLAVGQKVFLGYGLTMCEFFVEPGRYFFWDSNVDTELSLRNYFCNTATIKIVTIGADGRITNITDCTYGGPVDEFIEFTTSNMTNLLTFLEITNANDVDQWNAGLETWYQYVIEPSDPPITGASFTYVEVVGNRVKLVGGLNNLKVIYLGGLNLLTFTTNSTLPVIEDIRLNGNASLVVDVNMFSAFTTLQWLNLDSTGITSFNPTSALPASLKDLRLRNNVLTTFNPTLPLPSGLQYLYLTNTSITSFNPTQALPASLIELYLGNNNIVTFNPTIPLPSTLKILALNSCGIVTFNPSAGVLPAGLTNLVLGNNAIVTFNPSVALPSSLNYLDLQSNQIVTFNPTIALPASLRTLYMLYNPLSGFAPTATFPNLSILDLYSCHMVTFNTALLQSNILNLQLETNNFTAATVNAVLAKCVTLPIATGGVVNLRLNAAPTGQGITDKNTLIARGVTVQTA